MKILVTGCAGFIGMHTAVRLLAAGHEVVGVDSVNDYYDVNLKENRLAELSRDSGLDGIVCSGEEVAAVKAIWPKGYFIVPGVRPADGNVGDQKRVVTPRQALDRGASVLVIGRPITQAKDPDLAARAIEATL